METKPELKTLICKLWEIVAELGRMHGGSREFKLDGNLVGDIGEVVAEESFQIRLNMGANEAIHDGVTTDGKRKVSIKASFHDRYATKLEPELEYVLALDLHRDGTFEVAYNGPARHLRDHYKGEYIRNNRQVLPGSVLRKLQDNVKPHEQIPKAVRSSHS